MTTWKDAPDGPGLWVSRGAGYGEQFWNFTGSTWARCYPKGRRWYGPIVLPADDGEAPVMPPVVVAFHSALARGDLLAKDAPSGSGYQGWFGEYFTDAQVREALAWMQEKTK